MGHPEFDRLAVRIGPFVCSYAVLLAQRDQPEGGVGPRLFGSAGKDFPQRVGCYPSLRADLIH